MIYRLYITLKWAVFIPQIALTFQQIENNCHQCRTTNVVLDVQDAATVVENFDKAEILCNNREKTKSKARKQGLGGV